MNFSSSSLVLLAILSLESFCRTEGVVETVIATGQEGIQATQFRKYQNGACRIDFQRSGNLAVNGGFTPQVGWDTGSGDCDDYVYIMGNDGNFKIYHGTNEDLGPLHYSTNVVNDLVNSYFLGIHPNCTLGIFKGTRDNFDPTSTAWTNQRLIIKGGERLGKGEVVYDNVRKTILRLEPSNGNLVVYNSNTGATLWSAGVTAPADDFYMMVHTSGVIRLYAIADNSRIINYYGKRVIPPTQATCFSLVYVSNDLIGQACDQGPRTDFDELYVIMNERGKMLSSDPVKSYYDSTCQVDLSNLGALEVRKNGSIMWTTGPALPSSGTATSYYLNLQPSGNLVTYAGTPSSPSNKIWASNSNQKSNGKYFLGIDKECVLGVYKGSSLADKGARVWSNVLTELRNGQILYRSIIVQYPTSGVFMVVHPTSGKLLVVKGTDWTSSNSLGSDTLYSYPASNVPSNAEEFYATPAYNGDLVLKYEVGKSKVQYGLNTLYVDKRWNCYEVIPAANGTPSAKECD